VCILTTSEAVAIPPIPPVVQGFDVVTTDLHMRVVGDGMEFARHVRAHCPGVSLLLASANAPPISEHSPFDAFFIKPYQPEDIVTWIRRRQTSTSDHADNSLR
jgi:CheY-like chemotaxis protein